MDDLLREFLTEAGEHLETVDGELVRLQRDACDRDILRNVLRLVHTIKGTCGFLGLPRLEALAHAAEGLMERLRDETGVAADWVPLILLTVDRLKFIIAELERLQVEPEGSDEDLIGDLRRASEAAPANGPETARPAAGIAPAPDGPSARRAEPRQGTVRVGIHTLEHLTTTVSELALARNELLDQARRLGAGEALRAPLQRLSDVTAALQDGVMKTRMQPIGSAWTKLPRLVRDLSRELGKPIDLVLTGAEIELDRQIIEIVRDPFTHLVRNAADHGIEDPAAREAAGKPAAGSIRLHAAHNGDAVTIEVADDGRGLDADAIRRQAIRRGLATPSEAADLGPGELAELIFEPGFSTTDGISSISGRGVGMDVVRTNVARVGGAIEVVSERSRGVLFRIRIPLTLPPAPGLTVRRRGPDMVEAAPREAGRPAATDTTALLVVRGRDLSLKAVRLSRATRLIEVDSAAIAWTDGRPMLRRDGRLVPILHLEDGAAPARGGRQALVVVTDGAYEMALAVREIVDVADATVDAAPADLPGRATVRGRSADLVDLAAYLPRAHRDWTALSAQAGAPPGEALLIDDNPFVRAMLGPVLRAAGLQVLEAGEREAALQVLDARPISLVATDFDPGDGAGLDLVAAIRGTRRGADLPIVGLASGLDEATLRQARRLGLHAVVAKFDRVGLLAALQAARPSPGEAA